jgi:tetratricopeptide (TPR) repeat protein
MLIRMLGFAGNLGRANAEATQLAKDLGTQSPVPWIELGFALELSHRYDEALERYDQAAVAAPADPLGPRTGGLRAARWGELEEARPRREEARRRDARDAEVWHALGLVCLGIGDLKAADRAYRSGLAADPRALENRIGLATIALVEKDPAAALLQYDAILSERPKHADAKLGRAWALMELGRLTEARRALAEARSLGADPAIVERQARAIAERSVAPPPRDQEHEEAPRGAPPEAEPAR